MSYGSVEHWLEPTLDDILVSFQLLSLQITGQRDNLPLLLPVYTPVVSFILMMREQNDLLQISPTAWNLIGKELNHSS